MFVTYRYRLLPEKRQHRALESILEAQRMLYNGALEERIEAYRKAGVARTYYDQCKALTEWRRDDVDAAALPVNLQRWTLKRLDDSFGHFFRRVRAGQKPGFPRFRGKGRYDAFGFAAFSGIRFAHRRLRFHGMPGALRVHLHRDFPEGAEIKSCVFRRHAKGWQVSLVVDRPEASLRGGSKCVGIDLGLSAFAVLSDGGVVPSLRAARKAERRVARLQRSLARKAHKSNGRRKARATLSRCYASIAHARANHLHQSSARLIRDYDVIAIERLPVAGLARGMLRKDVLDASWGNFISMLRYKAACAGSRIIEVDAGGTSQECSGCGTEVRKSLEARVHLCCACGLQIDRDLNAARNILRRAGVGPGLPNVAR